MLSWFKTWLARRSLDHAESLRLQRQWKAAQEAFQKAIDRASGPAAHGKEGARQVSGVAYLGLGKVCLRLHNRKGETARAIEHFDAACRMQPASWEPFYYRGCGEARQGDYDKAEESFSAALAKNATEARIYLQRGHARFKAGRLDGALEDYLAAQRFGQLPERECLALAALRMQRGEHAEAEALLRALVAQGCAEVHPTQVFIPAAECQPTIHRDRRASRRENRKLS